MLLYIYIHGFFLVYLGVHKLIIFCIMHQNNYLFVYSLLVTKKCIIFSEWLHSLFNFQQNRIQNSLITSNMKHFVKVIHSFYPLTILAKGSILDVWQGLDAPQVLLNCCPKFLVSILTLIGFIIQYLYLLSLAHIN